MESRHSEPQGHQPPHTLFLNQTVVLPQGEAAFHALRQSLECADPEVRIAAAKELHAHRDAAVAPLCAALRDPDERVRISAAESLGQLGDPAAIGPLTQALRQNLVGGSGQRQLLAGVLLVLVILVIGAGYLWGAVAWRMGGGFVVISNLIFQSANRLAHRRRARSQICRTISEALARIAEQHPSPQLREIIPELRALAADRIYQNQDARQASREAADRIDTLTERLKSLPISSSSGVSEIKNLPVASAESGGESGTPPAGNE